MKSIGFAGWCMLTACMMASVYAGENSQNKVIEVGNAERLAAAASSEVKQGNLEFLRSI